MTTAVAVFTRDLRVTDNPMLTGAVRGADRVVPLFVLDGRIAAAGFAGANRLRFLEESLADLDRSLRELGGRLVLRRGDPVDLICRVAAQVDAARVHIARDVSGYAHARESRLDRALAAQRRPLVSHDDVHTVVAPGALRPGGKDHYAVFSPYHRAWAAASWRPILPAPERIRLPDVEAGTLPDVEAGTPPVVRPGRDGPAAGGERAARRRAGDWIDGGIRDYERRRDELAAAGTSRLSPYLHLGCVSALELARRAGRCEGARAFVRQLAWRDFHHQVLAARPDAAHRDYHQRGDRWRDDPDALDAWRRGETGIPIVDAGMRQLLTEGWMHNRARMITASFLTKSLYLDWRAGAAHFLDHLVDGDLANNNLNWQWIAGTGTDTRPNRVLNPLRQAQRHDPQGDYVRRHVPELAALNGPEVHQPWRLPSAARRGLRYPAPILDLTEARRRFLAARTG